MVFDRAAFALALVVVPSGARAQEGGDDVPDGIDVPDIDVSDIDIPDIDTSGLDDIEPTPAPEVSEPDEPSSPTPTKDSVPDPVFPPSDDTTTPSEDSVPDPVFPSEPEATEARDPRGGFTSYIEGLTYAPTLQPLSLTVLPTSQSYFDSYLPIFGDEGGASGLWLGYQGTGVAGLATMGLALAGNALFQFPNDVDLSIPLAAGGFNDRSPLSVGQGLLGVYGRLGPVSVGIGGAGALESVPVVGQKNVFGYGVGCAAELAFAFSEDNHIIARATATELTPFDGQASGLIKIDPMAGVMLSVFGTPLVVGVGAAIVVGDGRETVVAPRIFIGAGVDGDDNDPAAPDAPPSPDAAVPADEPRAITGQ